VQFETVTTPAEAVRPEHPASVPPDGVSEITALDVDTTLPAESSMLTVGCVVKAVPDTPATGDVVKTSCVAGPGPVGEKLLLGAEVSDPDVATIVYCVPTIPAKLQLATLMTPFWGTKLVQALIVPLEGTTGLKTIGVVAEVTTLLEASSTVSTGSMANTDPESPATGWVVNNNWVAAPVILNFVLVTDVRPGEDAVRVSCVAYLSPSQPENTYKPAAVGLGTLQFESTTPCPPLLIPRLMTLEAEVTTLPKASSTATVG
jgi:hypothetical protein